MDIDLLLILFTNEIHYYFYGNHCLSHLVDPNSVHIDYQAFAAGSEDLGKGITDQ